MSEMVNRRQFVSAAAIAGTTLAIGKKALASAEDKPALLGGKPVRTAGFPGWPRKDGLEGKALMEVLNSGAWFRGGAKKVEEFEETYARLTGAKHCIATNGGTTALVAALGALGVGPGDEVIVTPYTFIATITAIMMHHALPIFVDIDPQTFQIDAGKIEAAITDRTAAIIPVHMGGNVSDMDAVLTVARKHNLPVVEDACQAHLAEWRGQKVGTLGAVGCFSFQVSKNLPAGEGGAVLTNDDELAQRIFAIHHNAHAKNGSYVFTRACNFRMTEFQGALLLAQMTRIEQNARLRDENAKRLTELLDVIPGIVPAKMHEGCTRNSWHFYMTRYQSEQFGGLSRKQFLRAIRAEGIYAGSGYAPVPWEAFIKEAYGNRTGRRLFSEETLAQWPQRCQTPETDKLYREQVWFMQNVFLGTPGDMEDIAAAIRKIHTHASELLKLA